MAVIYDITCGHCNGNMTIERIDLDSDHDLRVTAICPDCVATVEALQNKVSDYEDKIQQLRNQE